MFNKFFSENRTVYEIISKNMVETEGPQMTSQRGAYALHALLKRLHALNAHAHDHPPGYAHARTYARASMHTQTNK
jgi:hypothetical protein